MSLSPTSKYELIHWLESIHISVIIEVEMIVHVSEDATSQQMTSKDFSILPGQHQTSLLEPGDQLLASDHGPVQPHVDCEVVEDLAHAGLHVVLDEHGGHGPGGLVQVLPGGQHNLLPAIQQLPDVILHFHDNSLGIDSK